MGAKEWSESLDVPMVESELAEMGVKIDAAIKVVEALEEQRKAAESLSKADIVRAGNEVKRLRLQAVTGLKKADVRVREVYVDKTYTVEIWRTDSNEKIRERPMSEAERQLLLPGLDTEAENDSESDITDPDSILGNAPGPKRGRGRPKGSKNKPN
jgi:hypothetical protein